VDEPYLLGISRLAQFIPKPPYPITFGKKDTEQESQAGEKKHI
jgi:hypothetical protein